MKTFAHLTLRGKLVVIIMLTSVTSLAIATAAFLAFEVAGLRRSMASALAMHASIVGQSVAFALDFDEPKDAEEVLATLAAVRSVAYGAVHATGGEVFADYRRRDLPADFPAPAALGPPQQFTAGRLVLRRPVMLHHERKGTVVLVSDLQELNALTRRAAWSLLGVLLLCCLLAYVMAVRLERLISAPILELAGITRRVSVSEDYSVEARKGSDDELGVLIDGFNEMMARIRARERELLEARDRSERSSAELRDAHLALRGSEEKYRGIFESASEGIFQVVPRGRFVTTNQALSEMLDHDSPEALVAAAPDALAALLPEGVDRAVAEELEREGDLRQLETTMRRRDGSVVPVSLNLHVVRNEAGDVVRWEGTVEDNTMRVRAEELRLARDVAEAATKAKSEFLANMSHEIRTPMNAIIGLTGLALRSELSPKQRGYLTIIRDSAQSLLAIINDILDFSKVEAGRLEIESVPFNLDEVLDSVANLFSERAAEKGIELLVSVAPDVPRSLVGDPLRIGQILINLVSNAVRFTERGEVALSVRQLETEPERVRLLLAVRDTGIGIPAAKIPRIFESFSQADSSTTRQFGGTGLGLAISKRMLSLMGGGIHAESEPGAGSTFLVELPVARQIGHEVPRLAPRRIRNLNVMVVDDNATARQILGEMLVSFDFRVSCVADGPAALDALARPAEPVELLLLDYRMEGMDGLEVTRRIRAMPGLTRLPVIMMTAFGREGIASLARAAGVDGFLVKPVRPSVLLDTIMEVLGSGPSQPLDVRILDAEADLVSQICGARVLLVEDIPVNQKVAQEILASAGVQVELAASGAEALSAVAGRTFDAVLMDVQMPELDGYEATRLIRLDPRHAELPIIAMTAHALKGEREKCLDAGMSDYLSKPIDPHRLFATLARWVKGGPDPGSVRRASDAAVATASMASPLPAELPGIDLDAARRRFGGNDALVGTLLLDFHRDFKDAERRIRDATARRDLDGARRLAHTIKGVAANLSAHELAHAAARLEQELLHTGDESALQPAVEALARALVQIDAAAAQLRATPAATDDAAPLPDPALLTPVLARLDDLLAANDLEAAEGVTRLRALLGHRSFRESLDALDGHVGRLDFGNARSVLERLAADVASLGPGSR